jgi:hypothetical protein
MRFNQKGISARSVDNQKGFFNQKGILFELFTLLGISLGRTPKIPNSAKFRKSKKSGKFILGSPRKRKLLDFDSLFSGF